MSTIVAYSQFYQMNIPYFRWIRAINFADRTRLNEIQNSKQMQRYPLCSLTTGQSSFCALALALALDLGSRLSTIVSRLHLSQMWGRRQRSKQRQASVRDCVVAECCLATLVSSYARVISCPLPVCLRDDSSSSRCRCRRRRRFDLYVLSIHNWSHWLQAEDT